MIREFHSTNTPYRRSGVQWRHPDRQSHLVVSLPSLTLFSFQHNKVLSQVGP